MCTTVPAINNDLNLFSQKFCDRFSLKNQLFKLIFLQHALEDNVGKLFYTRKSLNYLIGNNVRRLIFE